MFNPPPHSGPSISTSISPLTPHPLPLIHPFLNFELPTFVFS